MAASSLELELVQPQQVFHLNTCWNYSLAVHSLLAERSGLLMVHPQAEAVVQSGYIQHSPLPETEIQMQLLEAKCSLQNLMF